MSVKWKKNSVKMHICKVIFKGISSLSLRELSDQRNYRNIQNILDSDSSSLGVILNNSRAEFNAAIKVPF